MKGFIIAIVLVVVVVTGISHLVLYGWHHEIARGEHTGYVTAVVDRGIFFKTMRVYVKTDTQSSQEDSYCVTDPAIYAQLQQYGLSKTHINAYFLQWIASGLANCSGEGDVIYKVEVMPQ